MLDHMFPGDSEMAGLMRAFDWSTTDIGSPDSWPENLRIALSICLTSRFPMQVWWGPNLTMLYNDAYVPFLGSGKHPRALGSSARDIWSEIWRQIGPMLDTVVTDGVASWTEDIQMFGTFSFSPIFEVGGGEVEGAFCVCTEVTGKAVAARLVEAGARELGESEERYRTLFASAPMALFVCDRNAVIQYFNPRASQLWGREPMCGVDKHCGSVKLWLPDGTLLPHDQSPMVEVLRTGLPAYDVEVLIERPDGSRLPVLVNFAPLKNALEEVTGAITSFVDITERKQAELLMAVQMQALALLAQGAALDDVLAYLVGVVESHSLDGVFASIVLLNAAGTHFQRGIGVGLPEAFHAALEGVEVSSLRGMCCHAVSRREPVAVCDFNQGTEWEAFAQIVAPLGLRSGWSAPIVSSSSQILGTFATYYRRVGDPTPRDTALIDVVLRTAAVAIERTRVEETLRKKEENLSTALTASNTGIFRWDPNADEFFDLDAGFKRLWDFAPDEPLRHMEDVVARIHPDDRPGFADAIEACIEGATFDMVFRVMRPDGGIRWLLDRAKGVFDRDEKIMYLIGTCTDITDRKVTEEALKESDRHKSEFLAVLAHELRNPLAPIRNGLQILRAAHADAKAIQSASEMMARQVDHMVRLVDDLLDVSRISRGTIELRRERVELARIVDQAVETSRPAIDRARHQLTVTLPPQPVWLHADPVRLAQVLSNLLNNACKYSASEGQIALTAEQQNGDLLVTVKDAGVGIPSDMLPRIFEMFTQADRSLERSHGGLGIGLTLVKNLVELHHGTVEAHSAGIGHGSEFVVHLPIVVETPVPAPQPAKTETASMAALRILVVDDNRDAAECLAMLLECRGHTIHTAHDGLEAVDAAARLQPDVILLDIGLPRLNGYDAARRIREQQNGKRAVMVALTGWGQDEDRRRSQDAGFDAHMVKPVDDVALMKKLVELGVG